MVNPSDQDVLERTVLTLAARLSDRTLLLVGRVLLLRIEQRDEFPFIVLLTRVVDLYGHQIAIGSNSDNSAANNRGSGGRRLIEQTRSPTPSRLDAA